VVQVQVTEQDGIRGDGRGQKIDQVLQLRKEEREKNKNELKTKV
jgi:hypothetical protein